jgi:hypothetical protein
MKRRVRNCALRIPDPVFPPKIASVYLTASIDDVMLLPAVASERNISA